MTVRYYAAKANSLRHGSGRSYSGSVGSVVDVPDTEAEQIDHVTAGYLRLGRAGTTAQRPTVKGDVLGNLKSGDIYLDTTISKVIFWTGSGWIDMTGAAV